MDLVEFSNSLVLPKGSMNDENRQIRCEWRSGPEIADLKFIMEMTMTRLDCNVPWLQERYSREDYMQMLSCKVDIDCNNSNRYMGRVVATPTLVDKIVAWVEGIYKISLYQDMDSDMSIRPENTPRCPNCSTYLHMRWVEWGTDNRKSLTWRCPNYVNRNCGPIVTSLWRHMMPPLVTKSGVFFHNWELDGHPIPKEYIVQPLSEWSLTRMDYGLQSVSTRVESATVAVVKNKLGRGNKLMTEEQEALLRETYAEFGPATVILAYPESNLEWIAICKRAHTMGLKENKDAPGRRMRKYITKSR